ncbi:MAG: electron transfer flavoprotein subunit alpha/FixB family protein [Xanthomonadales bacterium]|nr:electron transfer flavoprotein subunit alpha/FixB family protein [Xanthomonadales bacterium]
MNDTVLVIAEQRNNQLNPHSLEVIAAGQQLAAQQGLSLVAALPGATLDAGAASLAETRLDDLLLVQHDLLEPYTADAYCAALGQLMAELNPKFVLIPHTYQARDFAPKLAASLDRSLISDCVGIKPGESGPVFVRQLFQGKVNADVVALGEPPYFVSLQAGCWPAESVESGSATPRSMDVSLDASQIRARAEAPERGAAQAVDLSSAEIIVSVGNGIEKEENIEIARQLAAAIGGELGASRPVIDEGWLPLERQIGSSGQTVAPKLYLALGISGSSQHLVGMKGAKTIVAVNKDANAPIFKHADYGIVGDVMEVMPALIKALQG